MPTHCTARVRDRRPASCIERPGRALGPAAEPQAARAVAGAAPALLGIVADDAAHDLEKTLGEALGVGVVGALRVHMEDGLVGVG